MLESAEPAPPIETESQPQLLPNEQTTAPPPTVSTSLSDCIKQGGQKVFEYFGVKYLRSGKGGRIKRDSEGRQMPGKNDVPLSAPATALPPSPANDTPPLNQLGIDPSLVQKVSKAALKGVCRFGDRLVFQKAVAAQLSPAEAQQLVTSTTVTQEELESFGELAEICFRQYAIQVQHLPLIGLGVVVAGIGTRYSVALGTCNAQIKRNPQPPANNVEPMPKPESKP